MINLPNDFWLIDPAMIPRDVGGKPNKREIVAGPLINLHTLQALLKSGQFDTDRLWIATKKCENDLRKERWSVEDVLFMLADLQTGDFKKSELCQVNGGRMVPCDAYEIHYDVERRRRHPRGLAVYLKFSIDDVGFVTIVLVSCHAS